MTEKKLNWSNQHIKLYNMLYNYVKTIYKATKEDYIIKYKRYLMKIIEDNEKWSNASKEALYFMISRYLSINQKTDHHYIKFYSTAGYDLLKKKQKQEEKNEQDEKEKENYKDHDYFINLLNSIDPNEIKTERAHYQYLLLNMLVHQAPIRTNFYITAQFIRRKDENDGINNFIRIDKKGKVKISYIVNNDKVSNTKLYKMNKNLSIIDIKDENLIKLIYESYQLYPRKYLFQNDNKEPISESTYLNWLRKITGVKQINNDMMRSSYVNWFYKNNKTLEKRQELANMMRHSVLTSQRNYLKVIDNEEEKEEDKPKLNKSELEKEFELLEEKNKKLEEKIKECEDKTKIDDKLFRKRRRDIIYNLNIKGREPRQDTLNKYNITFDKNLKKYI